MKVDAQPLIPPTRALQQALDDQARAGAALQQAFSPEDQVALSSDALGRGPITTETAVADHLTSSVAVEAAAAVIEAEKERFSALVFVLAHHGPPLG